MIPWSPLARGFLAGNRRAKDFGETTRAKSDKYAHNMYYQPSDFAVVDDGSPETGELMNLLVRRNLLFERLTNTPSPARDSFVVRLGTSDYPREDAADPSALALKIRRSLTDARRTLRIYGSEVVIGRLNGDAMHRRLHLLNYGGRAIEGLRVRVRGEYAAIHGWGVGAGSMDPAERLVTDGSTEFSLPNLESYAVVDLESAAR